MAVRPLLTTGVVLASAGAIIAATPGLMTPPNIAIAASDAAEATPKKSVTVNQLNLLGLSDINIQTISDIFFRVDSWGGIVGGTFDPYYGGDNYGSYLTGPLYVKTGVDAAGNAVYAQAVDADGKPLSITKVDAAGNPVVGDIPIYVKTGTDEAGDPIYEEIENPVFDTADPIAGDIYRDGLVGLAYYLSDQILDEIAYSGIPLISNAADFVYNNVNPYFFEAGIEETIRVVASELTGGINGPVGQALETAEFLSHNWLPLTGQLLTLAASGVPLAGPDLAAATSIFFFGGAVVKDGNEYNQGIDGVINYVVDRILGAPAPSFDTDEDTESNTLVQTLAAQDEVSDTLNAKSGIASLVSARKALPSLDKLFNIDLKVEEEAAEDGTTVDKTDGSAVAVTPVAEVSQPEAPKLEFPKLSNLKLDLAPKAPVKEIAADEELKETAPEGNSGETDPKSGQTEEKSGQTEEKAGESKSSDTAATTGSANKFTPKSRTTERKKTAGEKFVEKATTDLKNAFKPKTKAGADKAGKSKSDTGSSAASGSSDSGSSDSGSKDKKD
ncbi:hypothetical protein A5699_28215 [Mycobacterium sp. E802]|uniref:hypothetical protein n=1 Tax=Mycobacterium sp. E802 TaxID=1834152 RepID=UPI0008020015|nr:hypothetical protein [Mycobacterium sp. E802]OBG84168.1 hypothetical protein A5699_28215 [Mycobacterium sp. E802]